MEKKFIPYEKMSKKAKKETDRRKRRFWVSSPVTKVVASKKIYKRNKLKREFESE